MSGCPRVGLSGVCLVITALTLSVFATAGTAAEDASKIGEALEAARKKGEIAVVSLSKQMLTDEEGGAGYDCSQWQLTAADVKSFFRRATVIDEELLHLSYYTLPCNYLGSIRMAGKVYTFEINGGAYGTLGTAAQGASMLYGCKQACARVFPAIYDDEK